MAESMTQERKPVSKTTARSGVDHARSEKVLHRPALTSCLVTSLFQSRKPSEDKSQRASAEGVLYLFTKQDGSIMRIEGDFALTERLLEELKQVLLPGQSLVSVAKYYRHRGDGVVTLDLLKTHGLWVIQHGKVMKVRCLHQVSYLHRTDWREPLVLTPNYEVHGTTLSFPFIEPTAVLETMLS